MTVFNGTHHANDEQPGVVTPALVAHLTEGL